MHQNSHLAKVRLITGVREKSLSEILHERQENVDDSDFYFWDAEISNTLLDSHFTHMSERTLKNYAEDAQNGVAFLKGHDWRSLPIGYSLDGNLGEFDGRKRVTAGFYTIRSLPEASDLITRMQAKLLRDVSVGFHGGRTICDICGSDFWDCRHFPGLYYEEKDGDTVTRTLATFEIDDARLSEVSGVFDGSTPEAMIRKAKTIAETGDFTPAQLELVENRYRISLPHKRTFGGFDEQENSGMNEKDLAKVRSILGLGEDGSVVETVEKMSKSLDEAQERIKTLEPQAEEGQQYRTDLIEEALSEGVRAQGAEFDKELYESTLQNSSLAVVKRMRDDWRKQADKGLPAGRSSVDSEERGESESKALFPDEAYA